MSLSTTCLKKVVCIIMTSCFNRCSPVKRCVLRAGSCVLSFAWLPFPLRHVCCCCASARRCAVMLACLFVNVARLLSVVALLLNEVSEQKKNSKLETKFPRFSPKFCPEIRPEFFSVFLAVENCPQFHQILPIIFLQLSNQVSHKKFKRHFCENGNHCCLVGVPTHAYSVFFSSLLFFCFRLSSSFFVSLSLLPHPLPWISSI